MDVNSYNWDDLDVGTLDLNHSEKFFNRKHFKHEKFSEENMECMTMTSDGNSGGEKQGLPVPETTTSERPNSANKVIKDKSIDTKSPPKNIMRQPLTSKNQIASAAHSSQAVFNVIKYKDIYEKRRQEKIQRLLEEERKMRTFKSKPAPKFSSEPRKPVLSVRPATLPITPLAVKHSKENEEKRRRRIEEYKKCNQPQKFVHREPHVLSREPFRPVKPEQHVETQPFNLHMERRLEERKQYDIQVKQKTEERKRQVFEEEYERQENEERLTREIRKMTTFKARPNPFK